MKVLLSVDMRHVGQLCDPMPDAVTVSTSPRPRTDVMSSKITWPGVDSMVAASTVEPSIPDASE